MTENQPDQRPPGAQADTSKRRHCSYCFAWKPADSGRKLLRNDGVRVHPVWMCGDCVAKRT